MSSIEIRQDREAQCIKIAKAVYARSRFGWLGRQLKLLKITDGYDRLAYRLSSSYRRSTRFPRTFPSNTIAGLWHSQSRYLDQLNEDQGLQVLQAWIKVLYAPDCPGIGVEEQRSEMMRQRVATNMPWYNGEPGAAHFHFVDPLNSLVRDLSGELGPYS